MSDLKDKTIGIVSCYFHHNYGSMLQAYATQRIIEKLGFTSITIKCSKPIDYMTQSKIRYYLHKITNPDIVKTKLRNYFMRIKSKKDAEYQKGIITRKSCFEQFYSKNIKLSEFCKDRNALALFCNDMNAVLVGSDMLWHPVNIEHDYYTLTFVPDNIKKISYATSFGTTQIPNYQIETTKLFLKRFSSISVREKSGVDVIRNLEIGKEAQVVLDPTLLFTAEEWIDIQEEKPIIDKKYIFCYFLGVNNTHRKIANMIHDITGYDIVFLPHLDEYVEGDADFGHHRLYDIGPSEFVNLVRNAEIVCTDSFHGTCFSVLNQKRFFVFNRFLDSNTQSTNTRIDSLLSLLNLNTRRVTKEVTLEDLKALIELKVDYRDVFEILDRERQKSIAYLRKAIED